MPTLAPLPESIQLVRGSDYVSPPARRSVRDEGQTAEIVIDLWPRHSEFLTRQSNELETFDAPLAYVTFPIEKIVQASFTYVGELQPMPFPDSDD